MLDNNKDIDNNKFNKKAIGSLLLGIISIIGLFFSKYGTILSIAGFLLGFFGLIESRKLEQKGAGIALLGIILNSIGILYFVFTNINKLLGFF